MIVSARNLRFQGMATVVSGFDISGCLKAAAAIEADLTLLTSSLTEAQFHAPPRCGGWSVGHCVEHLVLTGQAFVAKWDAAIKDPARKPGRGEAFPYGRLQRLILTRAEHPAGWKRRAAPPFVPCARRSADETVGRFLSMHQEMVRRVVRSRCLDPRQTRVQSPFVSWIWYALGFSFDLALAHERRHLGQAWQVRRQLVVEEI